MMVLKPEISRYSNGVGRCFRSYASGNAKYSLRLVVWACAHRESVVVDENSYLVTITQGNIEALRILRSKGSGNQPGQLDQSWKNASITIAIIVV
jgi:hypothetical protein